MAVVAKHECSECGCEFVEEDRFFYWDDKSDETLDYLYLMMTCHLANGSKISGVVGETYCKYCKKHIKIYTITEFCQDIENPCKTVMNGIKNHNVKIAEKIDELKKIKSNSKYEITEEDGSYWIEFSEFEFDYGWDEPTSKKKAIDDALDAFHEQIDDVICEYEKYIDANYLVEINSEPKERPDYSEKISCPECGKRIHRFVNPMEPCPRCGGEIWIGAMMFCD